MNKNTAKKFAAALRKLKPCEMCGTVPRYTVTETIGVDGNKTEIALQCECFFEREEVFDGDGIEQYAEGLVIDWKRNQLGGNDEIELDGGFDDGGLDDDF